MFKNEPIQIRRHVKKTLMTGVHGFDMYWRKPDDPDIIIRSNDKFQYYAGGTMREYPNQPGQIHLCRHVLYVINRTTVHWTRLDTPSWQSIPVCNKKCIVMNDRLYILGSDCIDKHNGRELEKIPIPEKYRAEHTQVFAEQNGKLLFYVSLAYHVIAFRPDIVEFFDTGIDLTTMFNTFYVGMLEISWMKWNDKTLFISAARVLYQYQCAALGQPMKLVWRMRTKDMFIALIHHREPYLWLDFNGNITRLNINTGEYTTLDPWPLHTNIIVRPPFVYYIRNTKLLQAIPNCFLQRDLIQRYSDREIYMICFLHWALKKYIGVDLASEVIYQITCLE